MSSLQCCAVSTSSLFLVINLRSLDDELKARFLLRATQLPPNCLVKRHSFKKYVNVEKRAQTTQSFVVRVSSSACVHWRRHGHLSSSVNDCQSSYFAHNTFISFDFRSARYEIRSLTCFLGVSICHEKLSSAIGPDVKTSCIYVP